LQVLFAQRLFELVVFLIEDVFYDPVYMGVAVRKSSETILPFDGFAENLFSLMKVLLAFLISCTR
jgi:hypothetical protein